MMHPEIRDLIAHHRAMARMDRERAKIKRAQLKALQARPIGSKDKLAELDCKARIKEYVGFAQRAEAEARELRAASTVTPTL
jgi:hypothetical protein